ncbi:MAG: NACHT domain-containing protein [Thermodesulfobacteriota bacterium]
MILLDETQIAEHQHTVSMVKPKKYNLQETYPFGDLDDRSFEHLLYSLAKSGAELFSFPYDLVSLTLQGGDKGRDVVLLNDGLLCGIIQCKRTKSLIERPALAKEILKFVLHALQDGMDFVPVTRYMIACSTGLNREAIAFVESYPSSLIDNHQQLEDWCAELQRKYSTLKINLSVEIPRILTVLRSLRVVPLLPVDLSVAVASNTNVSRTFFELQSVIDATTFENIIKGGNLDIVSFLNQYAPSIKTNFSRVNFFGLSLTRRPREIELYALFVAPIFLRSGQRPTQSTFRDLLVTELDESEDSREKTFRAHLLSRSQELGESNFLNALISSLDDVADRRGKNSPFGKPVDEWTLSEILAYDRNFVVLGGPGAGKSSLIKYAMCKIADGDTSVIGSKLIHRIPFRVELSTYSTYRSSHNGGFAAFLANRLSVESQLGYISQANVQSLLEHYETFVFFDGLDEVADPVQRTDVRNDIENFTRNTPRARVIVTCRPEAFTDVPLKERDFELFEVQNFSDSQIAEYVERWYKIEEPDDTLRVAEAKRCFREISYVEEELRRNPLLLSLLLIIYRNNLEFPTSKLEIYESCANTLVETRDKKEKKLNFQSGTQNRIAAFSALAFWQYEALASKTQITHTLVLQFLSTYLMQKREYEDEPSAHEAAQQFIEFARVRSLYVDNAFTHKTFLEYFTANYIFTNFHSKGKIERRDKLFDLHFGDSSWSVVFELLLCRIDRDQPDYEVMDGIIEMQLERNSTECFVEAMSVLRYLRNVSVSTKRQVLKGGLRFCIDPAVPQKIRVLLATRFAALAVDARFAKLCLETIQDATSKLSHQTELLIFLLESGIQYPEFTALIPTNFIPAESVDPYVHLLLKFPFLTDTTSYVCEFQAFSKKFGEKRSLATYKTRFGGTIFGGSSSFSWITAVLLNRDSASEIAKAYVMLRSMGYRSSMIQTAIRRDTRRPDLNSKPVVECMEKTQRPDLKKLLLKALKKHWNIYFPEKQQNLPFYLTQKSGRRFPVRK